MGSGNGFESGVGKNLRNFIYEIKKFYCRIIEYMICYLHGSNRVLQGVDLPIHRMGGGADEI